MRHCEKKGTGGAFPWTKVIFTPRSIVPVPLIPQKSRKMSKEVASTSSSATPETKVEEKELPLETEWSFWFERKPASFGHDYDYANSVVKLGTFKVSIDLMQRHRAQLPNGVETIGT